MTEAEWLASDNPDKMLSFFLATPGQRKTRLFACACCNPLGPLLTPIGHRIIEIAEWYADGNTTAPKLDYLPGSVGGGLREYGVSFEASLAADHATRPCDQADVRYKAWNLAAASTSDSPAEWRAQGELIRDIFGNPFRPVIIDPAWRTPAVLALTRQVYDTRDFTLMPILADALQDAGCDNEDVLNHCRGGGPHVRGCHVVDLILGKS